MSDAEALRRVATAKRVLAAAESTINEPNVYTQIRLLNDLRKDNFFLSPNTWLQRNVVAGAGVNFYMGVEDFGLGCVQDRQREGRIRDVHVCGKPHVRQRA